MGGGVSRGGVSGGGVSGSEAARTGLALPRGAPSCTGLACPAQAFAPSPPPLPGCPRATGRPCAGHPMGLA